jgi:hypothetical protein
MTTTEGNVHLCLNHYQAANLRWLLALIHDGKAPAQGLDTGDWCGEIRWLLEQEMIERDVTLPPNTAHFTNGLEYCPPLVGLCCGSKRADHEHAQLTKRLERIQKVVALERDPAEKVRMIEELAKGWVNIGTCRAIGE